MHAVQDLTERCWDALLAASPLWASTVGEHRYADRLPRLDAESEDALIARLREIAADAEALDLDELSDEDRLTVETIRFEAAAEADHLAARPRQIEVAPAVVGPQVHLYELGPSLTLPGPAEAEALIDRYHGTREWFEAATRRLDEGLAAGRTPPRRAVLAAIRQIDGLLATRLDEDPLLSPAAPPGLDAVAAQRWRDALRAAVAESVRPGLAEYREHLERRIAPVARPDERSGLCWLPDGEQAYAAAIRRFTTCELEPAELHELGRQEVARLAQEYAAIGPSAVGTGEVAEIFHRLRDDPDLRFSTSAEVLETAENALERASAAAPGLFRRLPRSTCVVTEMAPHEVEDGTIAYYLPPAADGSRPGGYHVNTHLPETRTCFEAEALAFHESIPGHHLQIALAQELTELPPLRRHLLVNAYVEGWALYAERLADEAGLYSGPLERLGMLSLDSWRACRLVVDTGIHHLGWSRQQGIEYLVGNSPQALNNIENEVDRYIAWPGQALGYKVGQRRIAELRSLADSALGARFDLRDFHDRVLGSGALPLDVLSGKIARWISRISG